MADLPKLVIFDCDGVLVDSEPPTTRVIIDNLARYGLTLDYEQADTLFTGGTMKGVEDEARRRGAALPADWITEIYGAIHDRLRQGVPLIRDVVAVLDALDAVNIPYCVGSNGSETKMGITLTPSGLHDRLKGRLYSAHTLGIAKPDPGMFLRAATDFSIPPEACVVIDDSPTGCTAGVRAGMRTLGFAETTDPARLVAVGAEPVGSMAEVAARLGLDLLG